MKFKMLLLSLIVFGSTAFAQKQYPVKTIQDIQIAATSGDTVAVKGIVMTRPLIDPDKDRRPVVWAGARWTTYIQDENGQLNGGLFVLQDDISDTVVNKNIGFDRIDTAQVFEFYGVTKHYTDNGSDQMELLLINKPVNYVKDLDRRPIPIELNISDLQVKGVPTENGPKYEGMYVILRNVTTSNRSTTNGTFTLSDADGNTIKTYDQSGYFSTRSNHALTTTYAPPLDGTTLKYIRGIIYTRATEVQIIPVYPDDMLIGTFPPSIKSIKRNIGKVGPNQDVEVSATITDADNKVAEAKLFYHVNGGVSKSLTMTKASETDSVYKAVIPGVTDSSLVDFYVYAKDETNFTSRNPQDTVKNNYFYLVLNRDLKIQDVQYSPFGGGYGGYTNFPVTLTGVVTTDTTDIPGGSASGETPRVFIQNGNGPWSGIWVFGQKAYGLRRGDNVTVTGTITENSSNTRIELDSDPVVNSKGNTVPAPVALSTADIAALASGTVGAEKYESMVVKYSDLTVTNENADGKPGPNVTGNYNYGEILVADNSGKATRVELQDGNHKYHNYWDETVNSNASLTRIKTGDKFQSLTGVLVYSFSNYKLFPRKNEDFAGYVSGVNSSNTGVVREYNLSQNYPNPFNPSTAIEYSLQKEGMVSLKVFNMLGQEVKTLVSEFQAKGQHRVSFNASELPSGIYLYKLNSGNFTSVKKMLLVK